jgi:hypothetical protein
LDFERIGTEKDIFWLIENIISKIDIMEGLYLIFISVKYFDRRPPQRRQRRASDIAFDALGTLPSL